MNLVKTKNDKVKTIKYLDLSIVVPTNGLIGLQTKPEEDVLSASVAGTVQTRYCVSDKEQLKEQDGFLVSKSPILVSTPS